MMPRSRQSEVCLIFRGRPRRRNSVVHLFVGLRRLCDEPDGEKKQYLPMGTSVRACRTADKFLVQRRRET